jgi:pimeloyl-ACP methyl ester carboxylesterase
LPALDEARFGAAAHRRVPDVLRRKARVTHFTVPLAAGTGAAVLVEPRPPADGSGSSVSSSRASGRKTWRPLVILIHGLGDDCTFPHWHWMDLLLQQELAVLSVDWDGHGPGGGSHLDFQGATRSLPLLLQKLFGQPGQGLLPESHEGPPVFLMGHSTGAALALICASRPDAARHVEGVVAVSPTVCAAQADYRRAERLTFASPGAWMSDFAGRVPYYGVRAMLPRPGGRRHEAFPVRVRVGLSAAEQLQAFLRETFEERRILRKVNVPVLWLHGARDRFVPLSRAQPLMDEIPGALFSHVDRARGHVRMAFSLAAPQYAARFVATCLEVSAASQAHGVDSTPMVGTSPPVSSML